MIRAVRHAGKLGRILLITSDIYDELRQHITNGDVTASIFQNQYEQGKRGVHMLYHALADQQTYDNSVMIDPQIIMASNLDLF